MPLRPPDPSFRGPVNLYHVDMQIGNLATVKALIDSGANFSLIHRDSVPSTITIHPAPWYTAVLGVSGREESHIVGVVRLGVKIGGYNAKHDFFVLDTLSEPAILGFDFLAANDGSIRWSSGKVTFSLQGEVVENVSGFDSSEDHLLVTRANNAHINSLIKTKFNLDTVQKEQMQAVTEKFNDVLADKLEAGGCALVPPQAIDTGDSAPVFTPARRLSHQRRLALRAKIAEYLISGVMVHHSGPWASPAHMVRKKDNDWRFCSDYRRLNLITRRDVHPIPNIEAMLSALSGSAYFTTLDLVSGYHQIPIDKETQDKTAVITEDGLYAWTSLPFGLANAPAMFQRIMQSVLGDKLNRSAMVYIDDIVIFSPTWEDHLRDVEEVLTCLRNHKFQVKRSKCQFGASEIAFLGHIVNGEGVKPDPENIAAIVDCPAPSNLTQVLSFLGLANYYRKFIEGFAEMARPLHDLTKKDVPFVFGPLQTSAFERLKVALTSSPLLAHPKFDRGWIINVDASAVGWGATLNQTGDDARVHPVAFVSRAWPNEKWRKASATEREAYGLVHAMKHWRYYLELAPVTLVCTDHQALTYLANGKDCTNEVVRSLLFKINGFNYRLEYKPGRVNNDADALSRKPIVVVNNASLVSFMEDQVVKITVDGEKKTFAEWQDADPDLKKVKEAVSKNLPLPKLLNKSRRKFVIDGGVLKCIKKNPRGEQVLGARWNKVLPERLRKSILETYHDAPSTGAHLGVDKVIGKISRHFWWPGLTADVTAHIAACHNCALTRAKRERSGLMVPIDPPTRFWERVAVDAIGPLPTSKAGNSYALVFVDHLSRWPEVIAVPNIQASTTVEALKNLVVKTHGAPAVLLSDRGSNFMSGLMKEYCKTMGIEQIHTTAYHPQTNGMCERFNGTFKKMISRLAIEDPCDWDSFIPEALYAYRTSVHKTTGVTPYEMVYGHSPNEWADRLLKKLDPLENDFDITELNQTLRENRGRFIKMALEAEAAEVEERKRYYDRNRVDKHFEVGEKVFLISEPRPWHPAFTPLKNGPWVVLKEGGNGVTYDIQLEENSNKTKKVHVSRLEKFVPRRSAPKPEETFGDDVDSVFDEVSMIREPEVELPKLVVEEEPEAAVVEESVQVLPSVVTPSEEELAAEAERAALIAEKRLLRNKRERQRIRDAFDWNEVLTLETNQLNMGNPHYAKLVRAMWFVVGFSRSCIEKGYKASNERGVGESFTRARICEMIFDYVNGKSGWSHVNIDSRAIEQAMEKVAPKKKSENYKDGLFNIFIDWAIKIAKNPAGVPLFFK